MDDSLESTPARPALPQAGQSKDIPGRWDHLSYSDRQLPVFTFDQPSERQDEGEKKRSGRDTPERPIKCAELYTFGGNSFGQLGHGGEKNERLPRHVKAITFSDFESPTERSLKLGAGAFYTAVVSDIGDLFTFGEAKHGKLGHGEEKHMRVPRVVEAVRERGIRKVSCGQQHTVAVTHNGLVYTWGLGAMHRLGHNDARSLSLPKMVEGLRGVRVISVAAGAAHTVALSSQGEVWSWGDGQAGQLGHGDHALQRVPRTVDALRGKNTIGLAAGDHHSAAVTADGALYTWGFGVNGRLGHGDEQIQTLPKIVNFFASKGIHVTQVALGGSHSLALTEAREVFAWGLNDHGQLGLASLKDALQPRRVDALTGKHICQLALGSRHSAAVSTAGFLYTWGWAEDGQLGHNSEHDAETPTLVRALVGTGVVQVALGVSHTAVLAAPPWSGAHASYLDSVDAWNARRAPLEGSPEEALIAAVEAGPPSPGAGPMTARRRRQEAQRAARSGGGEAQAQQEARPSSPRRRRGRRGRGRRRRARRGRRGPGEAEGAGAPKRGAGAATGDGEAAGATASAPATAGGPGGGGAGAASAAFAQGTGEKLWPYMAVPAPSRGLPGSPALDPERAYRTGPLHSGPAHPLGRSEAPRRRPHKGTIAGWNPSGVPEYYYASFWEGDVRRGAPSKRGGATSPPRGPGAALRGYSSWLHPPPRELIVATQVAVHEQAAVQEERGRAGTVPSSHDGIPDFE
eukprot:tig00020938_g16128.t1